MNAKVEKKKKGVRFSFFFFFLKANVCSGVEDLVDDLICITVATLKVQSDYVFKFKRVVDIDIILVGFICFLFFFLPFSFHFSKQIVKKAVQYRSSSSS